MAGNETGVKYGGNETLRTESYIMALKANRDNMINGDTIPIIFYKEKRRMKREIRGKKIHARSLRQTYSIHQLTNSMENVEEGTKDMVPYKQANLAGEFEQSVLENVSGISCNSNAIVITDNRGKMFEPIYDKKGGMTEMKYHEGKVNGIPQSSILQKIRTVEKLSKELIDKSVEKGIEPSGYCTAVNALHEIASSGKCDSVQMTAKYAKTRLETDFLIVPYGMQSHILNIKNSLRELSEI